MSSKIPGPQHLLEVLHRTRKSAFPNPVQWVMSAAIEGVLASSTMWLFTDSVLQLEAIMKQ